MENSFDHKIADLKKWNRAELVGEWEKLWKLKVPKYISRPLLIRSIEYKYREQAHGGLSESCRKELNRLVKLYRKNPGKSLRKSLRIKPGTKLIRAWGQETHEVLVLSDGYLHKGNSYQTLSQVAREITGTRWSGPLFFGLRKDKEEAA